MQYFHRKYTLDDFSEILEKHNIDVELVNFIDPTIIFECALNELDIDSVRKFNMKINSCKIKVSPERVQEYLDKRFEIDEPELKKYIDDKNITYKPIEKWTTEELEKDYEETRNASIASPYTFRQDYYNLFVNRVNRLKKRVRYTELLIDLLCKNKKKHIKSKQLDFLADVFEITIDENGDISRASFVKLVSVLVIGTENLEYATKEGNDLRSYLYHCSPVTLLRFVLSHSHK